MRYSEDIPLIRTIRERCRVCYTCVRECPAKAIRIADGQAEILPERCIGCGNCVRVCSQGAKEVIDTTPRVHELLAGSDRVVACIAPSFPAEFTECDWRQMVGMVRKLGFDLVSEVGFGADLVALRYRRLLEDTTEEKYIATSCPAIVSYVERYHPNLVPRLAPIVSPMIAAARALRRLHGPLKIVFIGPCIAKKGEACSLNLPDEIDAALTFVELRQMIHAQGITPESVEPSDFDPPLAHTGALFSISRGLLQAARIDEDLIAGDVVTADGRTKFVQAIKEFQSGDLDARLLEVLCCNGCIMGAGMSTDAPLFGRRGRVSRYVRERMQQMAGKEEDLIALDDLDLTRTYSSADQRLAVPFEEEIRQIMARIGKFSPADELNCGACGYDTCRDHAIAIFKGLAETEMCLPYTIDQLRNTVGELADSHKELANTQEALMQSEKLASMGQLAAGIAHEVNNPLGVVLMYAHLLLEEAPKDPAMRGDLQMIAEQADRCKKIVSGLLHFARQNKVILQEADLCDLVDRSLRAFTIPDDVRVEVIRDVDDPLAEVDRDQIIQVLTNLISNALSAMDNNGTLTVRIVGDADRVQLSVSDTGVGIPAENVSRIFDPFYTTKQIGKGTGLGLAVTYGVVKMHRGDITVESNADPDAGPTHTTFTVSLPRREKAS
jgi:signal transduction histidine kinase/Fe-S-cluster-containing hydrogenase component 2